MDLQSIMREATQPDAVDPKPLGVTTAQEPDKSKLAEASTAEAAVRAKQSHADWLGHSTTQELISKLEVAVQQRADKATNEATKGVASSGTLMCALYERSAFQRVLLAIKNNDIIT